jgi:hypothetical protein
MDNISPSTFVRKALEMGVDPLDALRMRYRYLAGRVAEFRALYLLHNTIDPYFWWWIESATDLKYLVDYAKRYKVKPPENSITDAMILNAKSYPIDQLFELSHGRTYCFVHNSKQRDLSFHAASNRVHCFGACNRSFDSIDVLTIRDSMTFTQAVRFLQ